MERKGQDPEQKVAVWKSYPIPEGGPDNRYGHTAVAAGDIIYFMGGKSFSANRFQTLMDVWAFNTSDQTWKHITVREGKEGPRHRWGHTATLVDATRIFVFGGFNHEYNMNDCWLFHADTCQWEECKGAGKVPAFRAYHSSMAYKNHVIIFGGACCVGGPYHHYNDIYSYDLDAGEWSKISASGQQPSGRSQHSVAQVGKYMILFGGYNSRSVFSDVYVLDCESFKWKHIETSGARIPDYIDRLEPVPFRVFPSRREGGIVGTCFVTLGGIADKATPIEVSVLDLRTKTWRVYTNKDEQAPMSRTNHACAMVGYKLYMFGGAVKSNAIYCLDLVDILLPNNMEKEELSILRQLSKDMRAMLTDDEDKNVTFIIENKTIKAHKSVLKARSEFFRAMFGSGMRESQNSEIPLPDATYDAFKALLEFLYTGTCSITDINLAEEIFVCANQFAAFQLKDYCEQDLIKAVTNISNVDTLLQYLEMADVYQAKNLQEVCINLLVSKYQEAIDSESFMALKDDLKDLINNALDV
jgi:hypothetical protein